MTRWGLGQMEAIVREAVASSEQLAEIVRETPEEAETRARKALTIRVTDSGGTNIGHAVWREETQRWWTEDDRWQQRGRHKTFAQAEAAVRRRCACKTREEASRCR